MLTSKKKPPRNGGWTRYRGFDSIDDNAHDEDWDRTFTANVKSHLWLLQAAKPYLDKAPDGGAFVSTASLAGVSVSGSSLVGLFCLPPPSPFFFSLLLRCARRCGSSSTREKEMLLCISVGIS